MTKPRITVVVPVLNQQELTQNFLNKLRETEGEAKLPLLIIDNGSDVPVRDYLQGLREGDFVIRNDENVGVLKALNQAWQFLKNSTDYIFYIHNDVLIHEKGWDDKLMRVLFQNEYPFGIGVAGFYGAKGIGVPGIYNAPYQMHHLIRLENVSNCVRMNAAVHGFRLIRNGKEVEEVAVMDGFSLIVNTELLNKIGGFDRNYPPHHMYDNDICLEALNAGYRNIVIAMDAEHLGGRTDVGENWNKPFNKEKHEIHADAHPVFYEKWRPGKHKIGLPYRVP